MPIENMPAAVQAATLASPLRYYMESLLGIFLKGVGLAGSLARDYRDDRFDGDDSRRQRSVLSKTDVMKGTAN